mmetsp:Transcript_40549/g.59745  ORF Transcript_40549/g.59745 Transcript_40549/m.59745 type:complete len:202 (+) Transcript_40549:24-629(+)
MLHNKFQTPTIFFFVFTCCCLLYYYLKNLNHKLNLLKNMIICLAVHTSFDPPPATKRACCSWCLPLYGMIFFHEKYKYYHRQRHQSPCPSTQQEVQLTPKLFGSHVLPENLLRFFFGSPCCCDTSPFSSTISRDSVWAPAFSSRPVFGSPCCCDTSPFSSTISRDSVWAPAFSSRPLLQQPTALLLLQPLLQQVFWLRQQQ